MRGRATRVVLPTLVVLALVAVVADRRRRDRRRVGRTRRDHRRSRCSTRFSTRCSALDSSPSSPAGCSCSTGSRSDRRSRRRSRPAGIAARRCSRWLVFVALFAAFAYWRLRTGRSSHRSKSVTSAVRGQADRSDDARPGPAASRYEPSISWVPIAVILGLVLTAVIAYFVAERRARRERDPRAELAEELAAVLDDTLDDLRAEADPRRAVIAAYARLERVLAASGIARRPAETSDEYLARVLRDLALGSDAIARLTSLFTQAKFSQHEVDTAMKEEAIDALERVRDELRAASERAARPGPARRRGRSAIVRREVSTCASTPRRPDSRARRGRGLRPGTTRPRCPDLRARPLRDRARARTHGAATSASPRRGRSARVRRAPARPRPPASLARIEHEAALAVACVVRPPLPLRPAPALDRRGPAGVTQADLARRATRRCARRPRRPDLGARPPRPARAGGPARSRPHAARARARRRLAGGACSRGARPGSGAVRTGPRRGRAGGRRQARAARARAPRIPRRRPRPARGLPRAREDARRALVRAGPEHGVHAHPVHARPHAVGRHRARRSGTSATPTSSSGPGPIFTNLLLADEINRAPPKTQAALLEAMQERQVTIEGVTHRSSRRSSSSRRRTRSSTRAPTRCPRRSSTASCCARRSATRAATTRGRCSRGASSASRTTSSSRRSSTARRCSRCSAAIESVHVAESVREYFVDLVAATRDSQSAAVGASPRGSLALLKLARCRAALHGRDFVLPDDVKAIAVPALAHRLVLRPELWVQRDHRRGRRARGARQRADAARRGRPRRRARDASRQPAPRSATPRSRRSASSARSRSGDRSSRSSPPRSRSCSSSGRARSDPDVEVELTLDTERTLEGAELEAVADRPRERGRRSPRAAARASARHRGRSTATRARSLRLRAGEERELPFILRCTRWGVYELGSVRVRARDRFGS